MKISKAAATLIFLAATARAGTVLNDAQSQLNPTMVEVVVTPHSPGEIDAALRLAIQEDLPVSVSGGRHAMGGQQFVGGGVHIDMSSMTTVLALDRAAGIVTVEAGATWASLSQWLHDNQKDDPYLWTFRQKPTEGDRSSIGGGLSANDHGRGLGMKPIIADVESFTMLTAAGTVVACSRTQNVDLFRLVIGGYGLFGVIDEVRLRLTRRQALERVVETVDTSSLMERFEARAKEGFLYGDFLFATDSASPDFMRKGIFSGYRPAPASARVPAQPKTISEGDLKEILYLQHSNKKKAWELLSNFYRSANGNVVWSDAQQMTASVDDYHAEINRKLGVTDESTEMSTELFVPRNQHAAFMEDLRAYAVERKLNIIGGTVRVVEKDDESFLSWAREPWACTTLDIHVAHTPDGIDRAQHACVDLIDIALKYGGSYHLAYHAWASKEQVVKAHPKFLTFLQLKKSYDPDRRFRSEWYRQNVSMFADELKAKTP